MTLSALLAKITITAVFTAGTADNPSAVAPIEPSGVPQAFWWDASAFHIGERSFAWKDLGVTPADGRAFKVNLGESVLREPIELQGELKGSAPRYRVGGFGQIGNTNVVTRIEVDSVSGGTVTSYFTASGATQNYVMIPMSKNVKAGEKAVFEISSPCCSTSGRMSYSLTGADGSKFYGIYGSFHRF